VVAAKGMADGALVYVLSSRCGTGLSASGPGCKPTAQFARSKIHAGRRKIPPRATVLTVGNTRLRRFGEEAPPTAVAKGAIVCRERLGGLLNYHHRRAA